MMVLSGHAAENITDCRRHSSVVRVQDIVPLLDVIVIDFECLIGAIKVVERLKARQVAWRDRFASICVVAYWIW